MGTYLYILNTCEASRKNEVLENILILENVMIELFFRVIIEHARGTERGRGGVFTNVIKSRKQRALERY